MRLIAGLSAVVNGAECRHAPRDGRQAQAHSRSNWVCCRARPEGSAFIRERNRTQEVTDRESNAPVALTKRPLLDPVYAAMRSKLVLRSRLLLRPTICSATWPCWKRSNVGMARIPYSDASDCCSSILTLP